ncbi:hypothetical protein N7510_005747 [Penicillium lagena]|uniref:uncharacterized protein n=1 Tax=Penicillium lagena TaxID=94218 RepID=UPI0025402794|nr:uncharacterized protein N7510_005747 [Penicillium lagena]KAJ5612553.1 hypothetical protein N7510_005747 [Penicillium lagena]
MTSLAADAAQSGFQGWYILNESPEAIVCEPGYFTTSGSYAACAQHSSTPSSFTWNTGCDGSNTLLYQGGGGECISGASCLGMTIFQTSPYGMPVVTQFECVTNWVASTLYRELGNGFATTSTSVKTVAPAETSQTMHTPLATSTTMTQSPSTATPTSSNDNSSQPVSSAPASSGLSGGAIAGIVVGCLAGGFILACIFFFRKRIAAAFSGEREPEAQYYDSPWYRGHPQPQVAGAVSEMSSDRPPVELHGAHIARELDGANSESKYYA